MNTKDLLAVALLFWLGFSSSLHAQPGAGQVPQKRLLTIPVPLVSPPTPAEKPAATPAPAPSPASPASSLECVVACGTAIPTSALAFSPDGKTLAVGGYQEVLLWDLADAKLAKRIGAGQIGNMVRALVFGKDGKSLAIAEDTPYGPGAVKVFDVQTGQPTMSFQEPKHVVCCLALSPDGKFLAVKRGFAGLRVEPGGEEARSHAEGAR